MLGDVGGVCIGNIDGYEGGWADDLLVKVSREWTAEYTAV